VGAFRPEIRMAATSIFEALARERRVMDGDAVGN
jgi:hypothetical protein